MLAAVAALAVFLAVALVVIGLVGSRGSKSETERRFLALRQRRAGGGNQSGRDPMFRRPASSLPGLRRITGTGWAARESVRLEQAGVRLRMGEYLLMRAVAAAAGFVVIAILMQMSIGSLIVGVIVGVVGFMVPSLWVTSRRRHRIDAINRQLPEFLALLANSLRAGFAFLQSVETASRQLGPPLAEELQLMLADAALGSTTEDALQDLSQRTGSYDLEMVITAILVQRTTGGNLAELLDNVAETMRERERIHGEIRTFTAQQRLTGTILSFYPAALALLLFAMDPELWSVLWTDDIGRVMLAVAGALQVIGFIAIRRLLEIEY